MGRILIYIIAFFLSASIVTACSSGECLDNKSSIPLAGFYSSTTKKAITIDSISIYGIGAPNDSMILKVAKNVKQVYLPFRMNKGETSFVIHYDQKAISDTLFNDTITFKYEATPFFVSADCGAIYYFDIKEFSCTKHIIDSMTVPIMKITNVDQESIKLFMKTATPPEE